MTTNKKKPLPIEKRHAGQWIVKGRIVTPKGTKIDLEGPLHDAVGELVLALLTIRPTPERVAKMRALSADLDTDLGKPPRAVAEESSP